MGYLLLAFLLYLAYRFITGFVIPVARTTSQVRKQFHAMKEQMEQAQQATQQEHAHANRAGARGKYDIEGEYIPFEEVK
ncbi:MAG: hypothetical protein MUF29_06130 [Chitinophagaceae bacterium]|jgi:hypothetical protein|nr:hypothetical protein [Chitinophagaceae bacterium]